jgi:hypothetical protein
MQSLRLLLHYFEQHPPLRVLTKIGFVGPHSEYFGQTLKFQKEVVFKSLEMKTSAYRINQRRGFVRTHRLGVVQENA